MMQHTSVQALGQARLAGLHHQAQRDALVRGTRRRRRGRRGPGLLAAVTGRTRRAVIASHAGPGLSGWQLAPALFIMGAGMGLVAVPLLPFILSGVHPDEAGAASGVANAVQQVGGALGIAVAGEVFFGQLTASASYGHAFAVTVIAQVTLLAAAAALSLALPRRIAPGAYQPTI